MQRDLKGHDGGSNAGNQGGVDSEAVAAHGRPHSLMLTLPPLGAVILKLTRALGNNKRNDMNDGNDTN